MGRKGQRGQASILIAIIFQVVFIFFAMVINVGLLVHDKINLQNSADIAAYYGAMKQAESLNTIAHLNYQLRQAWKLLAWRVWSISNAGRNKSWEPNSAGSDVKYEYRDLKNRPSAPDIPVVCIYNQYWKENYDPRNLNNEANQNACADPNQKIPELKPFVPNPLMYLIPGIAVLDQLARKEIATYNQSCESYGLGNYQTAAAFMISYKLAMMRRRDAIKNVQKNLIQDLDISGNSIREVAERTFRKNLTAGNLNGNYEFEYSNSLEGKPFLTPIEVLMHIQYQDYYNGCSASIKALREKPLGSAKNPYPELYKVVEQFYYADYEKIAINPDAFANEPDQSVKRTTVGFEKNPWVLAYVQVKARSRPALLFSPGTRPVELVAEAYAMPFGGRIGPWYRSQWPQGAKFSSGTKIDEKLPLRLGEGITGLPTPPNYSRYVGDQIGMQSQIAQNLGLINAAGRYPTMPSFNDEYREYLDSGVTRNPNLDLVVSGKGFSKLRTAEIAAISPDVFDAFYYSINVDFQDFIKKSGTGGQSDFIRSTCKPFCPSDFGGRLPYQPQQMSTANVFGQIDLAKNLYGRAGWMIKNHDHVNTAWSHASPDSYPTNANEFIARKTKEGGRAGYSVKIVSRKYLQGELTLGGPGVKGTIANPPE